MQQGSSLANLCAQKGLAAHSARGRVCGHQCFQAFFLPLLAWRPHTPFWIHALGLWACSQRGSCFDILFPQVFFEDSAGALVLLWCQLQPNLGLRVCCRSFVIAPRP